MHFLLSLSLYLVVTTPCVLAWHVRFGRQSVSATSSKSRLFLESPNEEPRPASLVRNPVVSRRFTLLNAPIVAAIPASLVSLPKSAYAMTADAAKEQWKQSVGVIDAMLSDWSSLKSGDAVRVQLGTQGTTSPLFQIEKAFKVLREESSDIVEFTEASDDFLRLLSAADSMAYSANFAGGSGPPTPPAVYLEKARKEVVELQGIAKTLSSLL